MKSKMVALAAVGIAMATDPTMMPGQEELYQPKVSRKVRKQNIYANTTLTKKQAKARKRAKIGKQTRKVNRKRK